MKKFVFIAFAGMFLLGCNSEDLDFDNIKGPTLSGTFGFPLGEVKYSMSELIEKVGGDDLNLEEDSETSVLTLFYRDTLAYSAPNDLVEIGDIVNQGVIPVPAATGPTSPDIEIDDEFSVLYNPQNEEKLDSIFYSSGDLEATVVSNIDGALSYTLTFQNTTNAGTEAAIFLSGSVPDGGGSDFQTKPLANHITRLSNSTSNEFTVSFSGTISLSAAQSITGTEEISIDFAYRNQTFTAIFGQFGQDTLAVGNQEIDLGFFSDIGAEGIVFGNPKMKFDFRNSFGIPIGMDLSGVLGDDGEGGSPTYLSGQIVTSPPIISSPTELSTPVQSSFEINNTNSNLTDLLASSPNRLIFNVAGLTNPSAGDLNKSNFLQPTSAIDAYIEMEIPMEVLLENLEQSDTISLGGGINISDVESAFLRINTINELPFSALLSMDIQDSLNNSLYQIGNNLVLKAPFINVNGFVTDPSGATVDIPLDEQGLEALSNGSHIVMTILLNTPSSVSSRDIFVKLLGDYTIEIKVGIGGKLNVDF